MASRLRHLRPDRVPTPSLREALVHLLSPPPSRVAFVAGGLPSEARSAAGSIGVASFMTDVDASGPRRTADPSTGAHRGGGQRVDDRPTDRPSLDQVIDEYTPAVYRLARSVVRDPALADDVTQDTFIKVWKHLDDYRGEGSLRGWVLRIAHNTAVSTLRSVKDSATDPHRLPDAGDPISTNRVVEGRLAYTELQEALDQLDDLSREIVVLREVEGMSYDEIAEALGVPVPTVKTRLLRGRRRLAVALEGWRP